jgi:NAD(P)H dehydrogenase (quinone)
VLSSQAKSLDRRCFLAVLALAAGAAFGADKDPKTGGDKIVISGASGRLAGETLDALIGRGVKLDTLILVTRTPEKLATYAANGADVRAGDFTKPDSLEKAFAGGKKLLLISTSGGDRVAQHTAAIDAARRAGIRHIVYTSITNATIDNPALVARDHRLTEEALAKSGVAYTILRNQLYMDGLVAEAAQAIASGDLYSNAGRGKWAPVARRDCAEVAAVVLTTPGHEQQVFDITGPDLLNRQDFAKLITEVTGKRVRVIEMDDANYIQHIMRDGTPEAAAKVMASFGTATRANQLNIKDEAAQILTGHKPRSVKDLLTQSKAALLAASATR